MYDMINQIDEFMGRKCKAMYVIVCVDENLGMLFNRRRQSQDRILREYLLNLARGRGFYMNAYSAKQFEDSSGIQVSEHFLEEAGKDDFCFVENLSLRDFADRIDGLILCKWNREYPADHCLDLDYSSWTLQYTEEFPGASHEKITVEVFKK